MNTKTKSTAKRRILNLAKTMVAVAICYSIYSATSTYSTEIRSLANINAYALAGILALTIVYRIANAHGWSIVLMALGEKIPAGKSLRIWITAEACRWLPGSVWSYGSRAVQVRQHGASTIAVGSSLVLELILTITAWAMTAGIGLYAYRSEFAEFLQKMPVATIANVLFCLMTGVAAILYGSRRISRKIASKLQKLHDRLKLLVALNADRRLTTTAGLYYLAMCLFNGLICCFVVNTIAPDANVPVLAVVGINATAWLVGFFTFLAPGGLVVREGTLAAMLAIWMLADQALACLLYTSPSPRDRG